MSTIEVNHVWKKFRETAALKDIVMHMTGGHIYGIVGHNGSGKTVLLKCICGFYSCTEGEILADGKKIGKEDSMLGNAGIIIEEPGFIRGKSGYQNLEFLYTIRQKRNRKYLYEIMEKVGLNPKDKKRVEKYSLGMKQRLAIAQAIMEQPEILILDEPMNGLDREGVESMRILFEEMKREGKLIILASHSKEDIELLCEKVYQLENGTMRELGQ